MYYIRPPSRHRCTFISSRQDAGKRQDAHAHKRANFARTLTISITRKSRSQAADIVDAMLPFIHFHPIAARYHLGRPIRHFTIAQGLFDFHIIPLPLATFFACYRTCTTTKNATANTARPRFSLPRRANIRLDVRVITGKERSYYEITNIISRFECYNSTVDEAISRAL